jgi:hypothetical protein
MRFKPIFLVVVVGAIWLNKIAQVRELEQKSFYDRNLGCSQVWRSCVDLLKALIYNANLSYPPLPKV